MITANLPASFVDNPDLQMLLHMLREDIKIPSRKSMKSLVNEELLDAENTIRDSFPKRRKISLALDAWTSPNKIAFLAIVAFWMGDDWKLRKQLIGFEQLIDRHTGDYMAEIVRKIIIKYQLQDRLYAVTTDNATNNQTLTENLQKHVNALREFQEIESDDIANEIIRENLREIAMQTTLQWNNRQLHLPCFAHVIQLAVNAFLDGIKAIEDDDSSASHNIDIKDLDQFSVMTDSFKKTLKMVSSTCGVTLYLI
jgi:hypothetical protein